MTTREFGVALSGLSGDSLFRTWQDKQPREAPTDAAAHDVLARL